MHPVRPSGIEQNRRILNHIMIMRSPSKCPLLFCDRFYYHHFVNGLGRLVYNYIYRSDAGDKKSFEDAIMFFNFRWPYGDSQVCYDALPSTEDTCILLKLIGFPCVWDVPPSTSDPTAEPTEAPINGIPSINAVYSN